jgi:hypothetical protein
MFARSGPITQRPHARTAQAMRSSSHMPHSSAQDTLHVVSPKAAGRMFQVPATGKCFFQVLSKRWKTYYTASSDVLGPSVTQT